jgi:hypothetical protein
LDGGWDVLAYWAKQEVGVPVRMIDELMAAAPLLLGLAGDVCTGETAW